MDEQRKIDEAKYFLSRMQPDEQEPTEYSYDLSAFLSAARSALQYALDEAKAKASGQAWYESAVRSSAVVKFFKDKRDLSIHVEPVVPSRAINVSVTESIRVSSSIISIAIRNADGTVEKSEPVEPTQPAVQVPLPPSTSSVSIRFHFQDWPGQENVNALCHEYLQQVQAIVADGRQHGFIT
jgi:hypothetical protein